MNLKKGYINSGAGATCFPSSDRFLVNGNVVKVGPHCFVLVMFVLFTLILLIILALAIIVLMKYTYNRYNVYAACNTFYILISIRFVKKDKLTIKNCDISRINLKILCCFFKKIRVVCCKSTGHLNFERFGNV